MNRLFADHDGAGWRTIQRRRDRDLRFLAKVRACATLDDVNALLREQSKPIPEWRHVALMRAIKRVSMIGVSE